MNYTIAEEYTLPSKGKVYDKEVNPVVSLRSMTTEDEMKRTARTERPYKAMCDTIEDCLVTKPDVHVYDMCLGDYQFLLHRLRVVTYGKDYKMTVRCPYCGKIIDTVINLDELEVHEYDDSLKELLHLHLPVSDVDVELNLVTPRIQEESELKSKELSKNNPGRDIGLLTTLQSLVTSVDGRTLGTVELESFLRKLPMRDTNLIIKTAEKINLAIGIDNKVKVCCDGCGREFDSLFRSTSEFFVPTVD